jgi:hypothetical protein
MISVVLVLLHLFQFNYFVLGGSIDEHITSHFNETIELKYFQSSQLIRRSNFRNIYRSNDVTIVLLDIQKTGSSTLNNLFKLSISANPALKNLFFIPGVDRNHIPCTHHGDIEHLAQCILAASFNASFNERIISYPKKGYVIYVTMLRDPIVRLVSEYNHLNGAVSCNGRAWKVFHPTLCTGELGNYTTIPEDHNFSNGTSEMLIRQEYANKHNRNFEGWVNLGASNCACNRMTRQVAGPYGCVYNEIDDKSFDSNWMLNSGINNLENRVIFGLESSYLKSLILIEEMLMDLELPLISEWASNRPLQKACEEISCSNYTTKTGSDPTANWSNDLLNSVNHCTSIDRKMYSKAETVFKERLNKYNVVV